MISFLVFVKTLFMMVFSHDSYYEFSWWDGFWRWRGTRVRREGMFPLAVVSGLVWVTSVFLIVQVSAYFGDRAFRDFMKTDEIKGYFDDPKGYIQDRHEKGKYILMFGKVTGEYKEVVLAIREALGAGDFVVANPQPAG